MENLTKRRVDLLNKVREAVGVKIRGHSMGVFMPCIHKGKHSIKSKENLEKNPIRRSILNANYILFLLD